MTAACSIQTHGLPVWLQLYCWNVYHDNDISAASLHLHSFIFHSIMMKLLLPSPPWPLKELHCSAFFHFPASFLLWCVLSYSLLFLVTLPPVPCDIQTRCLSQGKSHSGACVYSEVSCSRPPLFHIPLLQGCRGRTCPVGGDTDEEWIQISLSHLGIKACLKISIKYLHYYYYGWYMVDFLSHITQSYPGLKADAVFGSEVKDSAVCSVKQVEPCCTVLTP